MSDIVQFPPRRPKFAETRDIVSRTIQREMRGEVLAMLVSARSLGRSPEDVLRGALVGLLEWTRRENYAPAHVLFEYQVATKEVFGK